MSKECSTKIQPHREKAGINKEFKAINQREGLKKEE
jgi:hypothetical protein